MTTLQASEVNKANKLGGLSSTQYDDGIGQTAKLYSPDTTCSVSVHNDLAAFYFYLTFI
jgi:hypothetical protein